MVDLHAGRLQANLSSCTCRPVMWRVRRRNPDQRTCWQSLQQETVRLRAVTASASASRLWTFLSSGFLTESGRKKASVILSTEDQSSFQVTQMKIKVGRQHLFQSWRRSWEGSDKQRGFFWFVSKGAKRSHWIKMWFGVCLQGGRSFWCREAFQEVQKVRRLELQGLQRVCARQVGIVFFNLSVSI